MQEAYETNWKTMVVANINEVKLIVLVHLYGTSAKMDEIRSIAREHGALIVEDAAESLGASYHGV